MSKLPGRVELLGVCYFTSKKMKQVIPNIVPEDVFYVEIITAGEVAYSEWGEKCICRRGTMLWHKGGDETIWQRLGKDREFISFAMRFRLLEKWERPGHIGQWQSLNDLDEFVIRTMHFAFDPQVDSEIFGNYLINRLFWEFYSAKYGTGKKSLPVALAKAITLIQNEDIASQGISALAEMAQVSPSHLHLLFKRHLKTTPHQYLLQLRLKRARILLSGTAHPVKAICSMCGFTSLESFYRFFRATNGLTPSEYRRRHLALLQTDVLKSKIQVQP